jgi:hypothetical protein
VLVKELNSLLSAFDGISQRRHLSDCSRVTTQPSITTRLTAEQGLCPAERITTGRSAYVYESVAWTREARGIEIVG